jgi:nucleoside-diphosphate-sugar epimerase
LTRVALFGAAGAIGASIAAAFRSENTAYRVVGRSRTSLEKAFASDPLAEIVTWNPDDSESIIRAAEGIETIVYLVGVDYHKFALHPFLMRKTIDGAVAAGVRQILLIGTVYPYGRPLSITVSEDHAREPRTFKGKMRKEQEDILFAAHESGKIQASELILPDFFGPGVTKSFLWSAFEAARTGGRAVLVGPIDRPHQFAYVPDVGPIVMKLLRTPAAWGQRWNFSGSGTITMRFAADKIFAAAGHPMNVLVMNKMMLGAAGLFNPLLRGMVEMHYLLTSPVLLDDSRLRKLVGGVQRTPYEQAIRATLAGIADAPRSLAASSAK